MEEDERLRARRFGATGGPLAALGGVGGTVASDSKISSPLVISAVAAAVGVLLAIFVSQALVDSARRDIDTKLAEASNAADATANRVSAIEDSVRGLDRDEIKGLGGQLSALERSLGDVRRGTASLRDEIAAVSSGLAGLEGLMVDPKAFAALAQDTATIQERLDSMPPVSEIAALRNDIAVLSGELTELQTDTAKAEELAQLSSRVASLELLDGTHAQTGGIVTDPQLETGLDAVVIQKLTERADALAQRLDEVPQIADMDRLRDAMAAISADLAKVEDGKADAAQLERLAAQTLALQQLVDTVPQAGDVAALETEIGVVSSALDGLKASMTDPEQVRELRDRISTLENRLGDLPRIGDVAELRNEIAALSNSLAELGAGIADPEEVRRLSAKVAELEQRPPDIRKRSPPRLLGQFYFDSASFAVADADLSALLAAIESQRDEIGQITIVGFADTVGSAAFNRVLSQRRAAAVRQALLQKGVPPEMIVSINGLGEDSLPLTTADGVPQPENRTVLIYAY